MADSESYSIGTDSDSSDISENDIIPELHKDIATARSVLADLPARLRGAEVRSLMGYLDLLGEALKTEGFAKGLPVSFFGLCDATLRYLIDRISATELQSKDVYLARQQSTVAKIAVTRTIEALDEWVSA